MQKSLLEIYYKYLKIVINVHEIINTVQPCLRGLQHGASNSDTGFGAEWVHSERGNFSQSMGTVPIQQHDKFE